MAKRRFKKMRASMHSSMYNRSANALIGFFSGGFLSLVMIYSLNVLFPEMMGFFEYPLASFVIPTIIFAFGWGLWGFVDPEGMLYRLTKWWE